jgi:hypothetical protein
MTIANGHQQDAEARLIELGGLGHDDSLRAQFVAMAMKAFADLLCGHTQLSMIDSEQLGALARIIANDAERVAERQFLDGIRRRDH